MNSLETNRHLKSDILGRLVAFQGSLSWALGKFCRKRLPNTDQGEASVRCLDESGIWIGDKSEICTTGAQRGAFSQKSA